jgi:hypothetical protein
MDFLKLLFEKWTIPKQIKTDNGEPFGVPSRDSVPIMSIWLAGWGITPILNRPRRPQDNAVVERNQGTSSRWAEAYECHTVEELQINLDKASRDQVNLYPVTRLKNQTRAVAFKCFWDNPRPYSMAIFDAQKSNDFLGMAKVQRKVNGGGGVFLYGKELWLGRKHKKEIVSAQFDPIQIGWTVKDKNGIDLKHIPDSRFSYQEDCTLILQRTS